MPAWTCRSRDRELAITQPAKSDAGIDAISGTAGRHEYTERPVPAWLRPGQKIPRPAYRTTDRLTHERRSRSSAEGSPAPKPDADLRAARGFNGDIGQHLRRWRQRLESGTVAADLLGIRVARKTLLAVAGLVSVHDHTWTTDRARAVQHWSDLEPGLAAQLGRLHSWAKAERHPSREEVGRALADDGVVCAIVERFGRLIGLWTDDPDNQ
jgi:hypothetical protein